MSTFIKSSFASLKASGTIKSLDGLRAIAILLVLMTHICQHIPGLSFVYWNTEWTTPFYNGWIGVDLFFVLSGFLIGSTIIKTLNKNTFSIFSFYMHRFFRILPAYFFMILLILLMKHRFQQHSTWLPAFNIKEILINFALVTDYISAEIGIPSWSLSIEEHFYLLLPCCLIFFRKTEPRINAMILLIFVALISRMITYRVFSISETFPIEPLKHLIYMPFHNRMDTLAIGVLIALIHSSVLSNTHGATSDQRILRLISCYIGLLLVGFVLISGALKGGFFNTTIQYSLVCLGFGGILWGVLGKSTHKIQGFLSSSPWIPIARISYSVYLSHLLIISLLNYFFVFKIWMFPLVLAICLAGALPLYLFIEHPCHQFGKKRFSRTNTRKESTLVLENSQSTV